MDIHVQLVSSWVLVNWFILELRIYDKMMSDMIVTEAVGDLSAVTSTKGNIEATGRLLTGAPVVATDYRVIDVGPTIDAI